MFQFKTTAAQQ